MIVSLGATGFYRLGFFPVTPFKVNLPPFANPTGTSICSWFGNGVLAHRRVATSQYTMVRHIFRRGRRNDDQKPPRLKSSVGISGVNR